MPGAFFRVRLSVRPRGGGEAELVPPNVLQDLLYRFVIVKEGGEEGIVRVEEPEAVLETIEQYKDCYKLTVEQMEALRKEYPAPKLKKKYRMGQQEHETGEGRPMDRSFAVDAQGNRILDTWQTIRSGFYLIDLLVAPD
jgi:hypothetical protein